MGGCVGEKGGKKYRLMRVVKLCMLFAAILNAGFRGGLRASVPGDRLEQGMINAA
jgi:hypothetical protein